MFELVELKPEHFADLIGTEFPIVDSELGFILRAVDRLKSPSPRGEPFSLSFEAPANSVGVQGIYRLRHPRLGVVEIFLVPVAPVEGRPQFEAVFN